MKQKLPTRRMRQRPDSSSLPGNPVVEEVSPPGWPAQSPQELTRCAIGRPYASGCDTIILKGARR